MVDDGPDVFNIEHCTLRLWEGFLIHPSGVSLSFYCSGIACDNASCQRPEQAGV